MVLNPNNEVSSDKKALVSKLKVLAKKSRNIWLAR
jgi:ribosomal protein L10